MRGRAPTRPLVPPQAGPWDLAAESRMGGLVSRALEVLEVNRGVLNALPDGILVADRRGRIVFCSKQLEVLSGYQEAELLGRPLEALVPPRLQQNHEQHRARYHQTGMPVRAMGSGLKIYLLSKGGKEIPVDIALAPLGAGDNSLVLAAVRDATQRTRVEQELRESRERFQLLLDGVQDYAIFMVDPAGRVASWNSGAERIKGYAAEEILGQPISVFYTPEDVRRRLPERALRVAADKGRFQTEGWRLRKDGSRFWAEVVITSLRDPGGSLRGFSKITRDATERKRANDRTAAITEIAQALLAGSSSEAVLQLVARRARELVDAAFAVLAVPDAVTGELHTAAVDGKDMEDAADVRSLDSESELAVSVPVVAEGRSLGVLRVANRAGGTALGAADRQVVELCASQAAVAIEYGRARDELRRLDLMEERERIGRELHDGVIQSLFAVGMNLQAAAMRTGDPELEQRIDGSVVEIDRAIRDLRNYIFGLRPGILADRQLAQALQKLAADAERESGVTVVTHIDASVAAQLASRAADVVQLLREMLSNVTRHAGATTCRVTLSEEQDLALLEVDDDGRGFDPKDGHGGGQGLRNLRERTASLGGSLALESEADQGTTVRIRIPL
ncbi:MAG: PAS domain S-box protein [Chloroflexi bacterium]|nr:MAG: PAS domain S-box protein [Chloroflexota bacterium]